MFHDAQYAIQMGAIYCFCLFCPLNVKYHGANVVDEFQIPRGAKNLKVRTFYSTWESVPYVSISVGRASTGLFGARSKLEYSTYLSPSCEPNIPLASHQIGQPSKCQNLMNPLSHRSVYEGHLESKERFAIKKYLLITGKKKDMQVLSHTFTYFSK